jgi:exonuclease III
VLLACWNVAGRVRALDAQAQALLALDAEIVCLQEVTRRTLPRWRELLLAAGYAAVEHAPTEVPRERPLLVLTAARQPLRAVTLAGAPWPERVLATRLAAGVEIVNVHSPTSPKPDEAKLRTHLAVHAHLAAGSGPRLVCGDLNTPRRELPDGTLWSFARDRYGRLREDRGERWERAELALLDGLGERGFRDAYRELHGYGRREISWGWRRWKGGYRLDHLIVSDLDVRACSYVHDWREQGLSDHSALVAELRTR